MKSTIGGRIQCGRDAETGRFLPVQVAKKRKATAVVERLKVRRDRCGRYVKAHGGR